MDFTSPRHVESIARRVRQFVDDEVIPVETQLIRTNTGLYADILQELRAKAKAAKLWAPIDPDVHPYQGCTQFLAPRDTPGISILRDVPVMGTKDFGGHGAVPLDATREE